MRQDSAPLLTPALVGVAYYNTYYFTNFVQQGLGSYRCCSSIEL